MGHKLTSNVLSTLQNLAQHTKGNAFQLSLRGDAPAANERKQRKAGFANHAVDDEGHNVIQDEQPLCNRTADPDCRSNNGKEAKLLHPIECKCAPALVQTFPQGDHTSCPPSNTAD